MAESSRPPLCKGSMDYTVDAIQRIEAAYVKLFEDVRNVEGEIIAFREEFRRSEEDRRSFHKAVLSAVLCRSKSGGHSGFYGEEDVQMDAKAKESSMAPNLELRNEDDDEVGGKRPAKSSNKVTPGNDDVQIRSVGKQASASHNPIKVCELDSVYIYKPFVRKDVVSSCSQFDIRNCTSSDRLQAKAEKVVGVRFKEAAVGGKKSGGSTGTGKQASSRKAVGVTKIGPFTLVNALQYHEEVAVVDYVFNEDLQGDEYIVKTEHTFLQRKDFASLKPGSFLIDEVLNVLAEFLMEDERLRTDNKPRNWYLPTRVSSGAIGSRSSPSDFIGKHKMQSTFMGNLASCKKIFIPLLHMDHWFLLIVCIDDGIVEIWDSLLVNGESRGKPIVPAVMQTLDIVLLFDIAKSKGVGFSFQQFAVITKLTAPQQSNMSDCGIFVANFMHDVAFSMMQPEKFHSQDQRLALALRIVLSAHNSECSRIKKDAVRLYCRGKKAAQSNVKLKRKFGFNKCASMSNHFTE